ncbi:MAG: MATE family efflux transporter [Lachnospiraceae bacterium]|nr:MATE family efflux transporter [Lachnospiraceae bacterium]
MKVELNKDNSSEAKNSNELKTDEKTVASSSSMRKKNTVDMTVGNPIRHILLFAAPLLVGNLFQQFYNLVDSIIVGKYINADALAATGCCASLNFLFFSLCFGLANGIGVIVSQYFGSGNHAKIKETVASAIYVVCGTALVVTLLGVVLARPLLILMKAPEGIIRDEAVVYFRTTCCGILFIGVYNGIAAILRALGDSKTPLVFLIISSFLNIGMDLLFVIVFDLGVFGVAFATVVAQFISAAISLIYACAKVPYFKLSRAEIKPHPAIIKHSFRLGVPLALQSSMIAISMIVLQGVVNSFGNVAMSANTITSKVDLIVSQFYNAMASAITTFSGQNFGANKIDRVKKGYKYGIIFTCLYNLIMIPIVYFLSPHIVSIFVDEAAVIELGIKAERILCFMYAALGLIYIPRGVLNGVGDARFSLINGISEVICRLVYSFALTSIAFIGQMGIWWAGGLTWVTVAIICNSRYLIGKWQNLSAIRR